MLYIARTDPPIPRRNTMWGLAPKARPRSPCEWHRRWCAHPMP
jgi:hypothetical protein